MKLDLKDYIKCPEMSKRLKRKLLSEQYSGGHWDDCHRNTAQTCTSLNRTAAPLDVPPLFALCCVKTYGLNQLHCSAETFLDAALSCLFKDRISPPPLRFCTAFIFSVTCCGMLENVVKTFTKQWPPGCQDTVTSVLHLEPQACQCYTAICIYMIISPKLLTYRVLI